jgi:hypothetical protein
MPRVILHIGQMKTGSTAIQVTLRKAQDRLKDSGILYPEIGYARHCHHALVPLFVDPDGVNQFIVNRMGFDRRAIRELARKEWSEVLDAATDPGISTVVLSSEAMFRRLSESEASRLVAALGELGGDVRVLTYVRNPATHYLSRVQQFLKVRAPLLQPSENQFLAPLDSYSKAFGPALECRVFDRSLLDGGDVVQDFLEWSGLEIEGGLDIIPDVNASVSAEAMSVLNRLGQPDAYPSSQAAAERQKHLLKLVEAADRALSSPTKDAVPWRGVAGADRHRGVRRGPA